MKDSSRNSSIYATLVCAFSMLLPRIYASVEFYIHIDEQDFTTQFVSNIDNTIVIFTFKEIWNKGLESLSEEKRKELENKTLSNEKKTNLPKYFRITIYQEILPMVLRLRTASTLIYAIINLGQMMLARRY